MTNANEINQRPDVEVTIFANDENKPCIYARVHDSDFIMSMKASGRDSQGKFYLFKWNQQHQYFLCAERNNPEKFVKISFSQRDIILQNNNENKSCVISGISDGFFDWIPSVIPLGQSKKFYISKSLNGFTSPSEPQAVMKCSRRMIHQQRRSSTRRTAKRSSTRRRTDEF